MVNEKGLDAAIAEINKKDGKFVWADTYVFLMDLDGKMLAHPMSPALIGKNVLDMKDKGEPGKLLFKEFVEVAKGKGEGWVDYMWINPAIRSRARRSPTSTGCRGRTCSPARESTSNPPQYGLRAAGVPPL